MPKSYDAWWEREEPFSPLPEHLLNLLHQEDPNFITELKDYAFSLLNCYEPKVPNPSRSYYDYRYLPIDKKKDFSWIWTLYVTDHPLARQAFLELTEARNFKELSDQFKDNRFQVYKINWIYNPFRVSSYSHAWVPHHNYYYRYIKGIFKLTERRKDQQVWAMLAHRFDADVGNIYRHTYSSNTRNYLRRRAWRFLRGLGEENSPEYVKFATEVLLCYTNQDSKGYSWNYGQNFSHLWLYNHIIYHHSKRHVYKNLNSSFQIVSEEPTEEREEAFPHLWDQAPELLWKLICEAQIPNIIEFAARALFQGNPGYMEQFDNQVFEELFQSQIPTRAAFAAKVLLQRSPLVYAKELSKFIFSQHREVRYEAIRFLLSHQYDWSHERWNQVLMFLIQSLQGAKDVSHSYNHWFYDVTNLLHQELFPILLKYLDRALFVRLVSINHPQLDPLIMEVFSKIDPSKIALTATDVIPFLSSPNTELVERTRRFIEHHFTKLQFDVDALFALTMIPGEAHQVFLTQFLADRILWTVPFLTEYLQKCWKHMLDSNVDESIRLYLLEDILGSLFFHELKETSLDRILLLLHSDQSAFQEFGARLLALTQPDPQQLSFQQLLELAHCPVFLVREEARKMIERRTEGLLDDWIVNLIETDWDDTREWMMKHLQQLSAVRPALIYGLLDTARTDVQQIAMQLVSKHDAHLDLKELFTHAAESPYLVVQDYALSLAERLDLDQMLLEKMELFFRTVLLHVNKGSQLKQGAFKLLLQIGKQDQTKAEWVSRLLSDVARNGGKRDFERILVALTQLQERYPNINTPILIG
ncbi:hypothetical protein SAMN05444392_106171 [Seinonella peptonophila]|uniref:HEAT repeat-containing protein n=1 Tax=Seinonella peptonophila TaxID=112248 RepID=A0A1M4YDH4_9BACL|nr:hypothetical protein [Seinonella peptonophila]SHF03643.1 hypothetical protein SAMN05444392_106171 [Seinonella peptonophila]